MIFKYVKKDIEKHQENVKDKSVYNLDDKDMAIKKEDLASAIRLFITLVLYRENENDKDEKIKSNKKNIIDYLKNKDLWNSSLYNNKSKFEIDLSKLKDLNIKIKEILLFYYYLTGKKDEGFEDEIINYMKKKEEEAENQKKIEIQLAKDKEKQGGIEEKDNDSDSDSDDDRSDSDDESEKKKPKRHDSEDSSDHSEDDSDDERPRKKKKKKYRNDSD